MQYAALAYITHLRQAGVQRSQAEVGAAWQNGYVERLMRTVKEEEVDLSEYEDYADATRQPGRFLDEVSLRQQHSLVVGRVFPRLKFLPALAGPASRSISTLTTLAFRSVHLLDSIHQRA